ncbi:MAG: biotin synthase BioB [Actinomycetota bacterium]
MNPRSVLSSAAAALLDEGRDLHRGELGALACLGDEWVPSLAALAHEVRLARRGSEVEVESIISAKTAGCPEDCAFCSQSSRFGSPVRPTRLMLIEELLAAARESAALGATEFCIVVAVRGPDERLMARVLEAIKAIRSETGLNVAASLGILSRSQAERLAAGGLHRYNHNLETARSFFPQIVGTHTWQERFDTCLLVKEAGMQLCCGAIIGMGESDEQRLELLEELRAACPVEVPVNFLNPRPGTPLENRPLVDPLEAIKWIALFRLALPEVVLRYAGGREVTLRELQAMGLTSGINALIVGNYLTTLGRDPQEDLQMLQDLKMPIAAVSKTL